MKHLERVIREQGDVEDEEIEQHPLEITNEVQPVYEAEDSGEAHTEDFISEELPSDLTGSLDDIVELDTIELLGERASSRRRMDTMELLGDTSRPFQAQEQREDDLFDNLTNFPSNEH